MWSAIQHIFKPPVFDDPDQTRRAAILNGLIWVTLVLGSLFSITSLVRGDIFWFRSTILVVSLTIILWLLHRGRIGFVSHFFVYGSWFFVAVVQYNNSFFFGPTFSRFLISILLAMVLLGLRAGLLLTGLTIAYSAFLLWAQQQGWFVPVPDATSPLEIALIYNGLFVFVVLVLHLSLGTLDRTLRLIREREAALAASNAELAETQVALEAGVVERTRALSLSAEVSRRLSTILEPDYLLSEVVEQVQQVFDYYHVHIYVLADDGQSLILSGATGEAGQRMLAANHRLLLSQGLVGRAARTCDNVRVSDTVSEPGWLPNENLPETKSEVAVPIVFGDTVLGVLDVQSNRIDGLTYDDEVILRQVADQVAVALQNARSYARLSQTLDELQSVQQQYLQRAWARDQVRRQNRGWAEFKQPSASPLDEPTLVRARQEALLRSLPAVVDLSNETAEDEVAAEKTALVAAIHLQGVGVGHLQMYPSDPQRTWSDSELAFVQAVLDQVAQAADNLRLLNETQERAGREQLVARIAERMRSAPDMDSLMQITVTELSKVLGPSRTFVRLGAEQTLGGPREGQPA